MKIKQRLNINHLKWITIIVMLVIVLSIVASACFLAYISPPEDEVVLFNYPSEFFCESAGNRIDYQMDGKPERCFLTTFISLSKLKTDSLSTLISLEVW